MFSIIGSLIYLPWSLFCTFNNITPEYLPYFTILFNIENSWADLIIIFMFLLKIPSIFWIIFLSLLILNIKYIAKENIFFLFLLIIFHFLLIISVYIISIYNLEWLLTSTFKRELLHLTPICGFLIGILLSYNEINFSDLDKKMNYKIILLAILFSIIIFIISLLNIIFFLGLPSFY